MISMGGSKMSTLALAHSLLTLQNFRLDFLGNSDVRTEGLPSCVDGSEWDVGGSD